MTAYNLKRYMQIGDCHEWTGPIEHGKRSKRPVICIRNKDGNGLKLGVPRLVWLQAGREVPAGHVVYRDCCNDLCINLAHLRCGPRGSHLTHRASLGLAVHMQSTRANLTLAARNRPTTKYSPAQAEAVRRLAADGVDDAEISALTGVGESMVGDIRRGKAWAPSVGAASAFTWRPTA